MGLPFARLGRVANGSGGSAQPQHPHREDTAHGGSVKA